MNSIFVDCSNGISGDMLLAGFLDLGIPKELIVEPINSIELSRRIELGLHEALVNAVIHGNLNNRKKTIRVRRIITPNWIIWQIQDQGSGLSVAKRNYNLPQKIDAESGRGLFLIHECFDDVRWSRKGNRLQLSACRDK